MFSARKWPDFYLTNVIAIALLMIFSARNAHSTDTQPPTAPTGLTVTTVSSTELDLSWTAATDNVGVTRYHVERCLGAACTSFTQIGAPTAVSYSDTSTSPSTTYRYRVRANDAAGNLGPYSTIINGTTSADTQAPTAPTGLTSAVISSSQVNLSWTASTDNVGVTGYRVARCTGSSCTSFAQIGTATTTTYSDTSNAAATTYRYIVRAVDAAGNVSGISNVANATTPSGDTQPPTVPTGLSATASGSSQISVSWTASTDNVGVTSYLISRCANAGCSSFAQVGTSTTPSFVDTGLTALTTYSYEVRATDAAGNVSGYSSVASATTQVLVTTVTYSYDNAKRLTQASGSNGGSVSYQYDANGNVTTLNRTAGP